MSRRTLAWTLGGVVLVAALGAWWWWEAEEAERARVTADRQAAAAEAEERRREIDERIGDLREESQDLMPSMLQGIELGMELDEAREVRPRMEADPASQDPAEPHLMMFEERFANGARAVYVFERESELLQRVQVLSLLPGVEAIAPHLTAMNERYGSPTGVWECPQTGGVPTRRFTWRHGDVTIADIFLVYGGRVSQTLYVAPTEVIGLSLRRSRCRPVRDRDELERFPVADPDELEDDPPGGSTSPGRSG